MSESFTELQYQFAANIRDPENHPIPAQIEARRMHIYQELFYNNIEGFIANGFPVLRSLVDDERWQILVRQFMVEHQCRSPYFLQISEEFLEFLNSGAELPIDFPFTLELAHYEWTELALEVSDEVQLEGKNGDWLKQKPLLSKLAWPLAYQFDVHRIGDNYCPEEPPEQPTFLVVYRDSDESVQFMEINAVTYRLLELIDEQPDKSGQALLEQIVVEMQHPNPEVVIDGGLRIMNELHEKGILLGVKS